MCLHTLICANGVPFVPFFYRSENKGLIHRKCTELYPRVSAFGTDFARERTFYNDSLSLPPSREASANPPKSSERRQTEAGREKGGLLHSQSEVLDWAPAAIW